MLTGLIGTIAAAVLAAVAKFFLPRVFKPAAPPPTPEAVAAAATTNLAVEQTTNAQIATAIQAERQSDARLDAHPDELRQPSPDSRD